MFSFAENKTSDKFLSFSTRKLWIIKYLSTLNFKLVLIFNINIKTNLIFKTVHVTVGTERFSLLENYYTYYYTFAQKKYVTN